MRVYYHPLSSYSQKTLTAFYKKSCALICQISRD